MIPIHELISRIRWDPEFGAARFRIGYLDRLAGGVVRVDFQDLTLSPADSNRFQLVGADGAVVSIPFHRVREVWRDDRLIWQRPGP